MGVKTEESFKEGYQPVSARAIPAVSTGKNQDTTAANTPGTKRRARCYQMAPELRLNKLGQLRSAQFEENTLSVTVIAKKHAHSKTS